MAGDWRRRHRRGRLQAISRAEAKRELAAADGRLAALQPQPEATADETWLQGGWAWLMGAALVLSATFGPALFARVEHGPPARSDAPAGPFSATADDHARPAAPASGSGPSDRPKQPDPPAPSSASARRASGVRADKQAVLEALLTDLALGRGFASQDELAQRFGRRKSTISDWLRAWEREGLIPARTARGRCKALGAA